MPRIYPQPPPHPLVPRSAYDASVALAGRAALALDGRTSLERVSSQMLMLMYGPRRDNRYGIVRYHADGRVQMYPYRSFTRAEFQRIAAAVPEGEWEARWRGARRTPQFVFRGVYTLPWSALTFHPLGDVSFGGGSRITLEELHAEANSREGVTVIPSRRRAPRPLPRYAVHTDVVPDPLSAASVISEEAVRRLMDEPPYRFQSPISEEAVRRFIHDLDRRNVPSMPTVRVGRPTFEANPPTLTWDYVSPIPTEEVD